MKIHEYNQMMAYLTRPATPTETPDIRQPAASGGRIELANGTNLIPEGMKGSTKPQLITKGPNKGNYAINRFVEGKSQRVILTKKQTDEFGKLTKVLLQQETGKPIWPDPKREKMFIEDLKKKFEFPAGKATPVELRADALAKKYPEISERQVERATQYYRENLNLNYKKGVGADDPTGAKIQKERREALKKKSDLTYENRLTGNEKFHKSHMSDLYTKDVRTGTIGYAKASINMEDLDNIDAKMKSLYKQQESLIKKNPKNFKILMDEINRKGTDLAAQSGGYKKFEAIDPITKKSFVINFSSAAQELDPTDILQNKKLSELDTRLDKKTVETLKENSMKNIAKLKASMIPGLDSLIDSVSSMPDDFKAKRYWTAGLKGLGIFVGTPLVVYDGYKAIRDGLPPDEVVAKALLGADKLLYKGKEILQLTPEEKKARTLIQQTRMTKQIAEDFSDLDSDFETPAVDTNLNLEEAKIKLKEGEDRYSDFRKGKDAQVAENRKTAFSNLKTTAEDMLNPYANSETTYGFSDGGAVNIKDVIEEYNNGGRVGYADGPKDPKRRTVIKGLTALAALPVIGKYFKLAPKAGKIATVAMEKVSGMPNWFQPFVNKVLKKGMDVTDEAATAEREIVKRMDIEDATVDVHYNTATNDVRVEVVGGKNALDEPLQMDYKAPEIIEGTGKKTQGSFSAVESKPQPIQIGVDDFDIETGENVTDVLDDLLSETDYLEGFATGKIRTPKEIARAKKRTMHRENMKKNPTDYVVDPSEGNPYNMGDYEKLYETVTDLDGIDDLLDLKYLKKK